MTDVLTNPAWHALVGAHASHADSHGIARRYDPDISVFHAIDAPTAEAWEDVAHLATNGIVVFLREAPLAPPPDGWRTAFAGEGYQMVRRAARPRSPPLPAHRPGRRERASTSRALTHDDVDAMVDLVTRTQPGPFRPGTIELGGYIGIFHDGRSRRHGRPPLPAHRLLRDERGVHRPDRSSTWLRVDLDGARRRRHRRRRRHADAARRGRQRLGPRRVRAARLRGQSEVWLCGDASAAIAPVIRASR